MGNDIMSNENEVIVICEGDIFNLESQDTCKIVDSGASYHVTSQKDLFSSYISGDFGMLGW